MPKDHQPHSQLAIIILEDPNPLVGKCSISVKGCEDCMIEAVTHYLLKDEAFKRIIKAAVKAANIENQKRNN